MVTQRPLVVETHSYPAVPFDDQPDRSAAHKKLVRIILASTMARPFTNTTEHHNSIRLPQPGIYQQHGRATNTRPLNVLAGPVLGATAEVCLSSDWLRGRSMLTRMLLYNSSLTWSIPPWSAEPWTWQITLTSYQPQSLEAIIPNLTRLSGQPVVPVREHIPDRCSCLRKRQARFRTGQAILVGDTVSEAVHHWPTTGLPEIMSGSSTSLEQDCSFPW